MAAITEEVTMAIIIIMAVHITTVTGSIYMEDPIITALRTTIHITGGMEDITTIMEGMGVIIITEAAFTITAAIRAMVAIEVVAGNNGN